jgi:hypothetical protein
MNQPRLTIAPWCENLIESMKFHRLEMDSEAESQTYKDMSDALRILFAGLEDNPWKDPEKQRVGKIYEDPIPRTEDSWMR